MPVKTEWTITYTCGHTENRDLSGKKPDERAGYARWLAANQTCLDCWRQNTGNGSGEWIEDKAEWLARKRAEEQQSIDEWVEQADMPALIGSEKQTAWASRIRYQLMHAVYEWAVQDGHADEATYEHAENQARHIDRARWWIDNREQDQDTPTDPETLLELLDAAAEDGDGTDCENPH